MGSEIGRFVGAREALVALASGEYKQEVLETALGFCGEDQLQLFALAREARDRCFPAKRVEVRSVIEVSNVCRQGCRYCNMGRNRNRELYTIEKELLLGLVDHMYSQGRRVLLLQSGENPAESFISHCCACIQEIKGRCPDMTLILCLGNLSHNDYVRLRDAGAERYILKFETSNTVLYRKMKPYDTLENRMACLEDLLEVGFKVGTGNIAGLPGQAVEDIVNDLYLAHKYPLAMSSCTVFIPAEDSEFKDEPIGDVDLTLNTMALLRIMNPDRLMPTTSSLEKARTDGQFLGLMAGANTVTIHDGTPPELEKLFPIYSVKRVRPDCDHMKDIVHRAGMKMEMD